MNEEVASQKNQPMWVKFSMEGEFYAFPVSQVREVVRVPEIVPVPGAPSFVLGIINLRGQIVTVIDLRERFGLPGKELEDRSRVLVVEVEGKTLGVLVDAAHEVIPIAADEITEAPRMTSTEGSPFIEGVVTRKDELIILLSAARLIREKEWEEVA